MSFSGQPQGFLAGLLINGDFSMTVLSQISKDHEMDLPFIPHELYYTQAESFYQLLPKRSSNVLDIRNPRFRKEFEETYSLNQKLVFWYSWYFSFAFSKSQKFGLQLGPIFVWIAKLTVVSFVLGTSSVFFEPVLIFFRSKWLLWNTSIGFIPQHSADSVVLPKAALPSKDGWLIWSLKLVAPQLLVRGTVFVLAPVASSVMPIVFSLLGPVGSFLLDGVTTTLSPFSFLTTPVMSLVSWGLSTPQGCSVVLRGVKAFLIGGITYVLPFSQLGPVSKILVGFFDVVVLLGRNPGQQLAVHHAQLAAEEAARTLAHTRAREQVTALQQQALDALVRALL